MKNVFLSVALAALASPAFAGEVSIMPASVTIDGVGTPALKVQGVRYAVPSGVASADDAEQWVRENLGIEGRAYARDFSAGFGFSTPVGGGTPTPDGNGS